MNDKQWQICLADWTDGERHRDAWEIPHRIERSIAREPSTRFELIVSVQTKYASIDWEMRSLDRRKDSITSSKR